MFLHVMISHNNGASLPQWLMLFPLDQRYRINYMSWDFYYNNYKYPRNIFFNYKCLLTPWHFGKLGMRKNLTKESEIFQILFLIAYPLSTLHVSLAFWITALRRMSWFFQWLSAIHVMFYNFEIWGKCLSKCCDTVQHALHFLPANLISSFIWP